MPYKKRRVLKSPNKNAERSQRNRVSAPTLESLFPEVERLVLDIQFSNRQGDSLQDDHLEYGPSDEVRLLVSCPGECSDGKTNLQAKIEAVVRDRQTSAQGAAQCASPAYGRADACGCQVSCHIGVVYRPGMT